MKYATRINSFLRFDSNLLNAFRSIGSIEGVDYVDLNYPEHFADYDIEVIKAKMEECGLRCNAINLRFRDKYIGGEFGNHEPAISQDAITLCREAADACRKLGGNQMIIWLGFDGFDYSFQMKRSGSSSSSVPMRMTSTLFWSRNSNSLSNWLETGGS